MNKRAIREKRIHSVSWGHWFTLINIFIALIIGLIYTASVPTTGNLLARLYLLVSWLGHFPFLTFLVFIIAIFPFCLLFPYSRFLRAIGTLVFSFAFFALILDALFFHYYQYHLNTYALSKFTADAEQWFEGASFLLLFIALLAYLFIFALQLIVSNLTWKKLGHLKNIGSLKKLPIVFFSSFILSHLIHIWADVSLFQPITQQDDIFPLSYPSTAKSFLARHGWISTKNVQNQSFFLEKKTARLRYPTTPLLCARIQDTEPTYLYVFDTLNSEDLINIEQDSSQLDIFPGQIISHSSHNSQLFELLYALPERYQETIQAQNVSPAYLEPLNNFGYQVQWRKDLQSKIVGLENYPFINQGLKEVTAENLANPHFYQRIQVQVSFAARKNLNLYLNEIHNILNQNPKAKIYLLSINPKAQSPMDLASSAQFPALEVSLFTKNVYLSSLRQLISLEDIFPNIIEDYMTCAGGLSSFSNALSFRSESSGLPRLLMKDQKLILFDKGLKSIFNQQGDTQNFNSHNQPIENQQAYMPYFIEGIRELQRFSAPERGAF